MMNVYMLTDIQIMISFLSSSIIPGGALLTPSDKIAYPDIKVGIPSMLLAIEMSIFAVLHIFAFSWKSYDIAKNPDPAVQYHGGVFGSKAIWEAFNLWDIVKAAARGFRWLFHGSRYRERDISYEASRQNSIRQTGAAKFGDMETTYGGSVGGAPPKYASYPPGGNDEQELGTIRGRPAPPMRTMSDESDDQAGLLTHAQGNPLAPPAGVPRINVREPSPFGDNLSRETNTGFSTPRSELKDPFDDRRRI
jgi:hypothetical protein